METMNVNYTGFAEEVKALLILLSTGKGIIVVPVQQITRIRSISDYSRLFFNDACPVMGGRNTLIVVKELRWFQEKTCCFSFVRIHRTHLINLNNIKNYNDGKTCFLFPNNGEKFSIARRKKAVDTKQVKNLFKSSS